LNSEIIGIQIHTHARTHAHREPGSSVSIHNRLRTGRPGFSSRQEKRSDFFSSPPRPNHLWNPTSLLRNG